MPLTLPIKYKYFTLEVGKSPLSATPHEPVYVVRNNDSRLVEASSPTLTVAMQSATLLDMELEVVQEYYKTQVVNGEYLIRQLPRLRDDEDDTDGTLSELVAIKDKSELH